MAKGEGQIDDQTLSSHGVSISSNSEEKLAREIARDNSERQEFVAKAIKTPPNNDVPDVNIQSHRSRQRKTRSLSCEGRGLHGFANVMKGFSSMRDVRAQRTTSSFSNNVPAGVSRFLNAPFLRRVRIQAAATDAVHLQTIACQACAFRAIDGMQAGPSVSVRGTRLAGFGE